MSRADFTRAVGMLASSAMLSHGVTAAALPILSRLYSPSDFTALAVFAGVSSVLSVVAALRLDIAVPIPEKDSDAFVLLAVSVFLAAASSLLLALLILVAPPRLTDRLNQPGLEPYLLLLPISMFLAGSFSALQSWLVRESRFALLARTRIAQSSLSAGAQIGLGYLSVAPLGLLLGQVLNSGIGCVSLGFRIARDRWRFRGSGITMRRVREVVSSHRRFPKYSTFEALFNAASMHVPLIMVAALASGPEAGYLALAMTLMQAPMSLIGSAIGHVYLSRAPREHRSGQLPALTADTMGFLSRTGVGPLVAAGIVSPYAFGLVFGADWQRAGLLVGWMTPWFVLQFLTVPMAMSLHVTGHQKHSLVLQLFGLIMRVVAVIAVANWARGWLGEAYAASGAVFYLVYLLLVLSVTRVSVSRAARAVASGLPYLVAWVAMGIVAAWLLSIVEGRS